MKKLLIIDDDLDLAALLSKFLTRKGYETESFSSGATGISRFRETSFDGVLCDYRLGDMSGKEVLQEIIKIKPGTIVLIITGYSDIKTAVDVIKFGAYDYIAKPLVPDELMNVLSKAFEFSVVEAAGARKKVQVQPVKNSATVFVGKDPATQDVYQQIALVAPTDYSVILYGESGTGKEVIARTIHESSHRRSKPFVAMDCGTLNKELSGSELFGHVKGSFTGAAGDKEGHFELANGGTLFLDEVGNLSPAVQSSLLRVIQERKIKRVGGQSEIQVDVRIIVASNENLQEAYKKGSFREDLYHRFNEFSINLPALRNRRKDIEPLSVFFLKQVNEELNKQVAGFDEEVIKLFKQYAWPGNIRELRNVIRRAALLSEAETITISNLPHEIIARKDEPGTSSFLAKPADASMHQNLIDASAAAEYRVIMDALEKAHFNKSKAAGMLNIDRKTLYNKLKEHSIKE